MIDVEKLRADIEAAQKNMSETIGRVCSVLVKELNACKPEAPTWKPEDLIGKLVWAWDTDKSAWSPQRYDEYLRSNTKYPYRCGSVNWKNIEPLTEAEAIALVWRPNPKTRYDWSEAPEWANFGAKDKNGNAYFYAYEPITQDSQNQWLTGGNFNKMVKDCILDASGDWRDSLERRPE